MTASERIRSLFGSRKRTDTIPAGTECELDGASVVAKCETMLGSVAGDGPAGALGLALGGARSACVIRGEHAAGAAGAIRTAAGRRAPFVAHLFARGRPAHAVPTGTGHEALYELADSGACVLAAQSVQDAAYLTFVARCVAERALLPVVVAHDEEEIVRATARVSLPSDDVVRKLAGAPGDHVPCPTEAQQFLFGEVRRRVPRWIDRARPALLGPVAGPEAWGVGAAGMRPWTLDPLHALLEEEFVRFAERTGIRFDLAPVSFLDRAETIVIALGSLVETAKRSVSALREEGGPRVGVVGVRSIRPFPAAEIAEACRGRERVLVLERVDLPLAGASPLTREILAAIPRETDRRAHVPRVVTAIAGAGGLPVQDDDLRALCRDPGIDEGTGHPLVYLGLDFLAEDRDHPKRQALRDRLGRWHPELADIGRRSERLRPDAAPEPPGSDESVGPAAGRRIMRTDELWASLPQFWDQTGVLYREGRESELAPDPQLALGAVPAFSSGLRDRSTRQEGWPSLDPARCTGCGLCWSRCPDGAIRVAALGAREHLDAALGRAQGAGGTATVLRSILAPLAAAVDARVRDSEPGTLADALRPAFEDVLARSSPPDDRCRQLRAALDAVLAETQDIPIARTEPFFEEAPKGKAALVSIAVDPAACQCCGICVAACEPGALVAAPEATGAPRGRRQRDLATAARVDALPPPAADTLERARQALGPAVSLLLSEEGRSPMTAGDPSEPGSGARLALRIALAAAVADLAPKRAALLAELDDLRADFASEIRGQMLGAVPTDDLDAIAKGLRALGGPDVDVADLIGRLEEASGSERVDTERLAALVDAAKHVADLRTSLVRATCPAVPGPSAPGTSGPGTSEPSGPPAPPTIVLAGDSLAGLVSFPDNPFAGPVLVAPDRSAARIAQGLLHEATSDASRCAQHVRSARAIRKEPLSPVSAELPAWGELDPSERSWACPVLLVLDEEAWRRQEIGAIDELLSSDLPVLLLVLSRTADGTASPALRALARRDVFTLRSSVGFPDQLAVGIADALARSRPAIAHVLAPSPGAAGVAPETLLEEARRPVELRELALFRFDPGDGAATAARLDLGGNPETTGSVHPDHERAWESLRELERLLDPGRRKGRDEVTGAGRASERQDTAGSPADESDLRPRVEAAAREERAELERRLTDRLLALSGRTPEDGASP